MKRVVLSFEMSSCFFPPRQKSRKFKIFYGYYIPVFNRISHAPTADISMSAMLMFWESLKFQEVPK